MSILSYGALREIALATIDPRPDDSLIAECSVDLTLDRVFWLPQSVAKLNPMAISLGSDRESLWQCLDEFKGEAIVASGIRLDPGDFALGQTAETLTVPINILCRIDGRSILGRFGLSVHKSAQHARPGWSGKLVLEFVNDGPRALKLERGMRICTIYYETLSHGA